MLKSANHWSREQTLQRGLTYGIFFLCAYTSWVRAGVHASLQWPMGILAAILCASLFFFPVEKRSLLFHRLLKDPVTWAGGCFLLLLTIQWLNSGYVPPAVTLDMDSPETACPKWIPWSFDRIDAAEMLLWFFPAVTVLLLIRNILSRGNVKTLIYLLVWNSAALACAGIFQDLLGSERIMGIWRSSRADSFATFDYPNHAAVWFYLYGALAAGLACDAEMKRKPRVRVIILAFCFLCCIAASCLTLSRFGAAAALLQLSVVFFLLLIETKRRLRGTKVINVYLLAGIIFLTGITLFLGAGSGSLAREVSTKTFSGERSLVGDLSSRAGHVATAGKFIAEHPLFGCGGWGCDHRVNAWLPSDEKRAWMVNGRANVHCDPVQFLAEFGITGSLCLLILVWILARDVVLAKRSLLWCWVSGGLALVLIHSLIDLPLRCPALLLTWCVLAAALPMLAGNRSADFDS